MLPLTKWHQTGWHHLARLIWNRSNLNLQITEFRYKEPQRDTHLHLEPKIQHHQSIAGVVHVVGDTEYGGQVESDRFGVQDKKQKESAAWNQGRIPFPIRQVDNQHGSKLTLMDFSEMADILIFRF